MKKVVKVEPYEDMVLIEELEQDMRTKGGIIVPNKEAMTELREVTFRVVEVGPGRTNSDGTHRKMRVKVGETVLVRQVQSIRFVQEDRTYYVIRETDIAANIVMEEVKDEA